MNRGIRRPSPAMVVAIVALIAALGGTAIAGGFVTKKKAKKIAANQVNKLAPGLSVASAKSADNAATANTANTANTAGSANNVLWAVVNDGGNGTNATLARSNVPGATVSDGTGVNVNFGRDVTGCAWIATKGDAGALVSTAGWAQTQQADGAAPNAVNVRTRDSTGGLDELDFHLEVIC